MSSTSSLLSDSSPTSFLELDGDKFINEDEDNFNFALLFIFSKAFLLKKFIFSIGFELLVLSLLLIFEFSLFNLK